MAIQGSAARGTLSIFLEQAKDAGIAMCVATSTPAELVKSALAGAGLDAYMEFVTTTGEAGRSKQFPDLYELALRRLEERHGCTSLSAHGCLRTPSFGLKALGARLKRVGIYDPHGRMKRETYAPTAISLSTATRSWIWPACFRLRAKGEGRGLQGASGLRLARGGERGFVAYWLAGECDHVVAVDRGLDALLGAGLGCDVYVGDADTVSDAGRALVDAATDFLKLSATTRTLGTTPIWRFGALIPSAVAGRVSKWLQPAPRAAVRTWRFPYWACSRATRTPPSGLLRTRPRPASCTQANLDHRERRR